MEDERALVRALAQPVDARPDGGEACGPLFGILRHLVESPAIGKKTQGQAVHSFIAGMNAWM
jgi:hypothetical protein